MKKTSSTRSVRSSKPASVVTTADDAPGVVRVAEPQLWFEVNEPAGAVVRVTNQGPSALEVSLWSRAPVGVPEPSLLAKLSLQAGHELTYTASNVVRVEILTEKPNLNQRYGYQVQFSQPSSTSVPHDFRVDTNRLARCEVNVTAMYAREWKTRVGVEKSKTEIFKTVVDAGVNASMIPEGVKVRLQAQDGSGQLPYRTIKFWSMA